MADEPRPGRKLAPIAAHRSPARSRADGLPLADPRVQVGPRTSRPARGLHERQHLKEGGGGRPRAGFRDFSLRSPEHRMGRSAR